MQEKEIKSQIRELKKVKKQCRAGTPERIQLHRKILDLKRQLEEIKRNKAITLETIIVDSKKYEQRYYTGFLSSATRERFKRDLGIEYIKKE